MQRDDVTEERQRLVTTETALAVEQGTRRHQLASLASYDSVAFLHFLRPANDTLFCSIISNDLCQAEHPLRNGWYLLVSTLSSPYYHSREYIFSRCYRSKDTSLFTDALDSSVMETLLPRR